MLAAAFPGPLYEQFRATGSTLRNDGPFEIFTYWPLAQDVRRMADANDAVVVTDGYGFSSQMDYEAGIPPVVIGYAHQGQEARHWYDPQMHPHRILFVDKEPLVPRPNHPEDKGGRPDFQRRLDAACGAVLPGPDLGYLVHRSDRPHGPGADVFSYLVRRSAPERDSHPALGRPGAAHGRALR